MKHIIAMLSILAITTGVMAAPGAGRIIRPASRSVVIFHQPYYGGFGYRPYYSPWGYNAFYNPYGYGYRYAPRPSKLDLNIEEISNDYSEQISDVRHDNSISGSERRSQIRNLRHERDGRIIQAKKDYYHPGTKIGTPMIQNNDDANNVQ